jgi:hypothetical protein
MLRQMQERFCLFYKGGGAILEVKISAKGRFYAEQSHFDYTGLSNFLTAFSPIRVRSQIQENQVAKNERTPADINSEPADFKKLFSKSVLEDSAVKPDYGV